MAPGPGPAQVSRLLCLYELEQIHLWAFATQFVFSSLLHRTCAPHKKGIKLAAFCDTRARVSLECFCGNILEPQVTFCSFVGKFAA